MEGTKVEQSILFANLLTYYVAGPHTSSADLGVRGMSSFLNTKEVQFLPPIKQPTGCRCYRYIHR